MARKLVRLLRPAHPDYAYLKKVFQHTRELLSGIGYSAERIAALVADGVIKEA